MQNFKAISDISAGLRIYWVILGLLTETDYNNNAPDYSDINHELLKRNTRMNLRNYGYYYLYLYFIYLSNDFYFYSILFTNLIVNYYYKYLLETQL